jgi:hypothetical protein
VAALDMQWYPEIFIKIFIKFLVFVLQEKFDRLDDRFIRPFLLRDPTKCDGIEISNYYEKLVMK